MTTTAIVQARMSSTRLPGKVLADIGGRPMLWYVTNRAQAAKRVDGVVVATSDTQDDDVIEEFCAKERIACFRGSRDDVLDRYYQAARQFDVSVIVRLTADCPLLDPEVIDQIVAAFDQGEYDYVSNAIQRTYPDGLDAETFSFEALQRAWRTAELMSEREHVTPYMWKHPELFRLGHCIHSEDLSALRWTVDEPADMEFIRALYAQRGFLPDSMAETVRLLRDCPGLAKINREIGLNEGYQKSLRDDSRVELWGER